MNPSILDICRDLCKQAEDIGNIASLSQSERKLCKKVAGFMAKGSGALLILTKEQDEQLRAIAKKIAIATLKPPPKTSGAIRSFFKQIGNLLHLRVSSHELQTLLLSQSMQRDDIQYLMLDMPQDVASKLSRKISSFFTSLPNKDPALQKRLFDFIQEIPVAQRAEALSAAISSVHKIDLESGGKEALFKIVATFAAAERAKGQKMVETFLKKTPSSERALVARSLESLPADQRIDVLACATMVAKEKRDYIDLLVGKLAKIPADEREEVVEWANNLLSKEHGNMTRSFLVQAIAGIPRDQRADVLTHIAPLIVGMQSFEGLPFFCTSFAQIPQDERQEVVTQIAGYMQEYENGFAMARVLDVIKRAPPEQRKTVWQGARPRVGAYTLTVKPDEIKNDPVNLLLRLGTGFQQNIVGGYLKIKYKGQEGIDEGGLARQFISDLFENLVKKLEFEEIGESRLFRPVVRSFSDEDKKVYAALGYLMMFCLNATRVYPTGVLLDQGVFTAIVNFPEPLLKNEFDQLNLNDPDIFDQLYALYKRMNGHLESERKSLEAMANFLGPLPSDPAKKRSILEEAFSIVSTDEEIEKLQLGTNPPLAMLEEHYEALQARLRVYFAENSFRPALAPLHQMARGMKAAPFHNMVSWQYIRHVKPSDLSDLLQGTLSREMLLERLFFDPPTLAEHKQQWVKEWISEADDAVIKRFLFALTGSSAIGQARIMLQDNSKSDNPSIFFHTCFNRVDLPLDKIETKEDFVSILEGSLEGAIFNEA